MPLEDDDPLRQSVVVAAPARPSAEQPLCYFRVLETSMDRHTLIAPNVSASDPRQSSLVGCLVGRALFCHIKWTPLFPSPFPTNTTNPYDKAAQASQLAVQVLQVQHSQSGAVQVKLGWPIHCASWLSPSDRDIAYTLSTEMQVHCVTHPMYCLLVCPHWLRCLGSCRDTLSHPGRYPRRLTSSSTFQTLCLSSPGLKDKHCLMCL